MLSLTQNFTHLRDRQDFFNQNLQGGYKVYKGRPSSVKACDC